MKKNSISSGIIKQNNVHILSKNRSIDICDKNLMEAIFYSNVDYEYLWLING